MKVVAEVVSEVCEIGVCDGARSKESQRSGTIVAWRGAPVPISAPNGHVTAAATIEEIEHVWTRESAAPFSSCMKEPLDLVRDGKQKVSAAVSLLQFSSRLHNFSRCGAGSMARRVIDRVLKVPI